MEAWVKKLNEFHSFLSRRSIHAVIDALSSKEMRDWQIRTPQAYDRVFGQLKKRFKILNGANPGYSIRFQAKISVACMVLQNFITRNKSNNQMARELLWEGDVKEKAAEDASPINVAAGYASADVDREQALVARRMWESRRF